MKSRPLGRTGLQVSELGFGVWSVATTWWGVKESAEGIRLLRRAAEKGVTFFDTADVYGNGLGETMLAEAFPAAERQTLVIATKFGYDLAAGQVRTGHGELPQDWSPEAVRASCEASLTRLGRDWIDVWQLHNPRMEAILSGELFETLSRLREAGKIRAAGIALGPDVGWGEEGLAAIQRGYPVMQIIYNLFEQEPSRRFFAPAAAAGTGLLVRVPHASGLLDGSYDAGKSFDKSDHRSHRKQQWMGECLKVRETMDDLTAGGARTLGQAAMLYALAEPTVATVLPNITNEAQIEEWSRLSDVPPLTPQEVARLKRAWEEAWSVQLAQPLADSRSKPTPRIPARAT